MIKIKSIQAIMFSVVNISLFLVTTNIQAESLDELAKKQPVTVSFFMDVEPGTTSFTSSGGQIGTKQPGVSKVNAELFKGKTLIVKSITINNRSIPFPNPDSFSDIAFGRCTKSLSFSGFGNASISTYGPQSNTVHFNPGLVAHLLNERYGLCVSSFVQSNETARVFVHGILLDKI